MIVGPADISQAKMWELWSSPCRDEAVQPGCERFAVLPFGRQLMLNRMREIHFSIIVS
jgi:hypothetical protein